MAIAKIVNLTGRTLHITTPLNTTGEGAIEFKPVSPKADATIYREVAAKIATERGEIPIMGVSGAELFHLPDPQPGTMYIVTEYVLRVATIVGRATYDLLSYPDSLQNQENEHDYMSDKLCFPQ